MLAVFQAMSRGVRLRRWVTPLLGTLFSPCFSAFKPLKLGFSAERASGVSGMLGMAQRIRRTQAEEKRGEEQGKGRDDSSE